MGILAAAAAVALLYYGRVFFITIVIATIIAFLLEPMVGFFMKLRFPRGLASFVVCSLWLVALYFVGLGLYTEGVAMMDDLPAYSDRINQLVDGASLRVEHFQENVYRTLVPRRFQDGVEPQLPVAPPEPVQEGRGRGRGASTTKKKQPDQPQPIQEVRVRPEPTPVFNYIYDYLRSFYNVLLMASFVPFLVYFILSWRDHLRGRLLAMLEGDTRYTVNKALDGVAEMVRAYVIGNFLLGLLLTIASAMLFALVKLPYWIVVAPMSGFLSLAPYIGTAAGAGSAAGGGAAARRCPGAISVLVRQRRHAAPAGAESALPQIRGLPRAPESAGGYHRADVLGHAVGRHRFAAGDSPHRGDQGHLR